MEITLIPKVQWNGIVKIDNSLDDYVKNVEHGQTTARLEIKDIKYHHDFYETPDVPTTAYAYAWPREITIWTKENTALQEYMNCDAVLGYRQVEKTHGIIRKKTYYEEILQAKGFRMESIVNTETKVPVLASYRASMGKDNAFNIKQKGIICYCSGSQSSLYDPAYKSLTCVFIASDEKPFSAYVRKKGSLYKVICDSNGIKEISQDIGNEELKKPKTKPKDDPLIMLKLRLAKGEITKEEFEDLRKIIE